MKLRITTLVIIENNQMENIYHSLEDNQTPITIPIQVQPSTSTYVPKTN